MSTDNSGVFAAKRNREIECSWPEKRVETIFFKMGEVAACLLMGRIRRDGKFDRDRRNN